jgi:hypothetical protein
MDASHLLIGTVDLKRLLTVRETGEMRNRSDWTLQPDAAPGKTRVSCIALA